MKKILTFFLTMGVVSTFVVYAHPATYDNNTGHLHIPDVEVSDNTSELEFYEVDLQKTDKTEKFGVAITEITEKEGKGSILSEIKKRGKLLCGGRTDLPGFGNDCDGEICGFDIDLCRAVAAAVLLKSTDIVEIVPASGDKRGEVLKNGKVDILSSTATWTSSRDAKWGDFTSIMFYDGQGFMVAADSDITKVSDLNGKKICVESGTTHKDHLNDLFGDKVELVSPAEDILSSYLAGDCDAMTSDRSTLASIRSELDNPGDHKLLEGIISKEPLTPIVPHGDKQWFNIVKTVMFALINAEELGITKDNVDDMKKDSKKPGIKRLLGVEGSFGQEELGLEKGAFVQVIGAVGNYGEIYDRHFGPDGLDIPRGKNKLWKEGGLIYAPPLQ